MKRLSWVIPFAVLAVAVTGLTGCGGTANGGPLEARSRV